MKKKPRLTTLLGMAFALCLGMATFGAARQTESKAGKTETSAKTVYVCACMKDSSCPCMGMAKKEGKCPCGADAPNMKEIKANSAWAKKNRRALE